MATSTPDVQILNCIKTANKADAPYLMCNLLQTGSYSCTASRASTVCTVGWNKEASGVTHGGHTFSWQECNAFLMKLMLVISLLGQKTPENA
jgi:hypothetical protein